MKQFIPFLFLTFFVSIFFAKSNNATEVENLRQTELAFSKMCTEKGMSASFIFYADKDVVKLNEGKFPIIGKDSLIASFAKKPAQTFKLEWYPVKVEVSKSADLGYTFGNWIFTNSKGETGYGNYMTVWKKQKDGTWKYVIDGGNSTPDPPSKK